MLLPSVCLARTDGLLRVVLKDARYFCETPGKEMRSGYVRHSPSNHLPFPIDRPQHHGMPLMLRAVLVYAARDGQPP